MYAYPAHEFLLSSQSDKSVSSTIKLRDKSVMGKVLLALIILHFSSNLKAAPQVGYNCANNKQISATQCETLVDFYHSTGGPNWLKKRKHSWLRTEKPCDWEGVTCRRNKVTQLEVPDYGLQGTLPDLGGLKHLKRLGLFNNPKLTGPLPDLTQLSRLSKISIFNTAMNGFLPDVSKIRKLTYLDIHNNHFMGPIPKIPRAVKFIGYGNTLCLSPRIKYSKAAKKSISRYSTCEPMLTNQLQGKLDVTHFGAIPDDNKNDHQAINHTFNMLKLTLPKQDLLSHLTVFFPSGTYNVEKSIKLRDFKSVAILGEQNIDEKRGGGQSLGPKGETLSSHLIKGKQFGNVTNRLIRKSQQGAIFDLRFGSGLTVKHLKLVGQLKSTSTPYLWWDHGIYIGSSYQTVIQENEFHHFGDSALTIATDATDHHKGINSSQHLVYRNYFYNITQTSTTSEHGGSTEYNFLENTAEHVKGAIKFATRQEEAGFLNIENNHIVSAGVGNGISTNNGIEVEGYKNVNISGNTLSDGDGVGIVIRSVQSPKTRSAYDWGDVTVADNKISSYRQAIYVSNLPHGKNGSLAKAENIVISNNYIENMWNGKNQAAIHFVGSKYRQCRVSNNTIVGGRYDLWSDQKQTGWLQVEGNMLN